jgi:hypothetical protein
MLLYAKSLAVQIENIVIFNYLLDSQDLNAFLQGFLWIGYIF